MVCEEIGLLATEQEIKFMVSDLQPGPSTLRDAPKGLFFSRPIQVSWLCVCVRACVCVCVCMG